MRLLYFLAHHGNIGGAANVMLKHARMMQNKGHEVCLVIQNDKENKHSSVIDVRCRESELDTKEAVYPIAICIEEIDIEDSANSIDEVKDIIIHYEPNLVHSLQLNISVELACRELGIPHIMSIYPLSDGQFNMNWDDIMPHYIMGDCDFYSEKWAKGLGALYSCIRVVYFEEELNEIIKENVNEYEIVSIGVLCSYKNQLETIKFVETEIRDGTDIHLTLLGDDNNPYGTMCREYVSKHELEKYVEIKGFVDNVTEYLRRADALIHVSIKESYPGVLVEAMANRVPVLVTPVGGISEIIKDEDNGIYIQGFTSSDIETAFRRFKNYRDNGQICKIIENGFDTYLRNHTEQVVSRKLEDFYHKILMNHKGEKSISVEHIKREVKKYNEAVCSYSDFTKNHIWFLWHIKRVIEKNGIRKAYVWGAGKYGAYGKEWCDVLDLILVGFVDSYKRGSYMDFPIIEPTEQIKNDVDLIFVGIENVDVCRNISIYLENLGFERNVNYFLLANNPCI